MISKKEYKDIANILNAAHRYSLKEGVPEQIVTRALISNFSQYFELNDKKFDRETFVKACNL